MRLSRRNWGSWGGFIFETSCSPWFERANTEGARPTTTVRTAATAIDLRIRVLLFITPFLSSTGTGRGLGDLELGAVVAPLRLFLGGPGDDHVDAGGACRRVRGHDPGAGVTACALGVALVVAAVAAAGGRFRATLVV